MNPTFVRRSLLAVKTLFHRAFKALAFLVLAAGLAAQADAQLVKYQFTGTKISGSGDIGTKISGTVVLDVGATPDYFEPYNYSWDYRPNENFYGSATGFEEYWSNGGFSINAVTDSGFAVGTFLGGGTTNFYVQDADVQQHYSGDDHSYQYSQSGIEYFDVTSNYYVDVFSGVHRLGDVVPGVVPNPWDPSGKEYRGIDIYGYSISTGVWQWGVFTLDTFTLVPTTIIIDGIDTGIDDFQYQGKLVSKHLADCAAAAKNHGDYVSCVAELTNALKKAGLLTGNQKGIIMNAAAQSSYGK